MQGKHKLIKLLFILMFSQGILHASLMEKPRKVYSLPTEHFNILFSKESTETAKIIAEHCEFMYEKASITFDYNFDQTILILISPDSDRLSVSYTPAPYNRIIVYDSVQSISDESYKDGLLDLLNHEIYEAVSHFVTTKFWYFFRQNLVGQTLQPVTLLNVPFSFLEGETIAEDEKTNTGLLNDPWNFQQLVQAKQEGKFPSLVQILGTFDTYPGKDFCRLAAGAFCAYIQNRWGYDKFQEYWELGGHLNFFFIHKGIFEKVYKISLEQAWNDFVDEIPITDTTEDNSEFFFQNSDKSLYKYILHSQYGFIWYDELIGEVDIYDDTLGFQKYHRLLFMANDVTNLTLSPDGRFLIVSHTQQGSREDFKVDVARIYDLKNRTFTGDSFRLRNGTLIQLEDGTYAIAGVNIKNKYPEIQIIPAVKTNKKLELSESKDSTPLFTRRYEKDTIPVCPIQLGTDKIAFTINQNGNKYLSIINHKTNEEETFQFEYDGEILNFKNLRLNNIDFLALSQTSAPNILMFDYTSKFQPSYTKTGMILFNQDYTIQQVIIQTDNLSGGVNDALFFGSKLYYSSKKFDHDEFRTINISKINFDVAEIKNIEEQFKKDNFPEPLELEEFINEKNRKQEKLGDYPIKNFNPILYMLNGAWMPFMPVKSVSFSEGIEQSLGLGVTFQTGADPFQNNELTLSAGFGFLPTDITMIFGANDEEKKDFESTEIKFFDDYTFAAYYKNSATPADILASTLFTFNSEGQYTWDVLGGIRWEVPLMMTFRRFKFDIESKFSASTTYWDPHQISTYPTLYNWPKFSDSYRSIQAIGRIEYTNIHQYGASPYKQMGIKVGMALNSTWDLNLIKLQSEKRKNGSINTDVPPENLSQAIENQLWGNPYFPTQINLGLYGTAEIPQLLSVKNLGNWIISLPTTVYGELFYTNGIALDLNFKTLAIGNEIQDGFNMLNVYFPRAGIYLGYDLQRKYDTNTVVLPDIRDFGRFYEAFTNTVLNDSIYVDINLAATPIIGQFSSAKIITDFMLSYYLRTGIWAVNFNMEFNF